MKKHTARFLLILITAIVLLMVCACRTKEATPTVIKETDTYIVIFTPEQQTDKNQVLIDYMQTLKDEGSLDFVVKNGMITSINNIDNASDFSSCWMLYTSDLDNSSTAWGSIEYDGIVCGSSVLGAELLKIKPNQLYVWVYTAF